MARIVTQRTTHHHEGPLVVFLIGMRINRPWRPDLWFPAFMPPCRGCSRALRGSGLRFARLPADLRVRRPSGGAVLDEPGRLYAYASQPDAEHRPAWAAFNRRARKAPGRWESGMRPTRWTVPNPCMWACPSPAWRRRPPPVRCTSRTAGPPDAWVRRGARPAALVPSPC